MWRDLFYSIHFEIRVPLFSKLLDFIWISFTLNVLKENDFAYYWVSQEMGESGASWPPRVSAYVTVGELW